jgi:hypothetical protein
MTLDDWQAYFQTNPTPKGVLSVEADPPTDAELQDVFYRLHSVFTREYVRHLPIEVITLLVVGKRHGVYPETTILLMLAAPFHRPSFSTLTRMRSCMTPSPTTSSIESSTPDFQ